MTEIISRHNGVVAQFIGDEVFAVFGSPIQDENKEINAVFCAIEMIEKSHELKEIFGKKLDKDIQFGIGINTGFAVVGNMGSAQRVTYSVIGDIVNTAKRIESLTREFPNTILIGEAVYRKVLDHVALKAWDPISVKGKANLIQVYEVQGRQEQID